MTHGTHGKIRALIREMLNEIDIEEVGQTCWSPGSTHDLKTCTVGDDRYYLKFSDPDLFSADDPSLQVLNEYLAYKIFSLYPGVNLPKRVELVYDRANKRVGLMTSTVSGGTARSVSPEKLAGLLSSSVYASIFLAHWDISNKANIIVSPDEDQATLIDPGGTMDFRARGERKGTMFKDDPSELVSMISGPGSRTDIFMGSDLRRAADVFLAVDWPEISSTIEDVSRGIKDDLQSRGMGGLLSQWDSYISHVAPILARRHKTIVMHAEHILEAQM